MSLSNENTNRIALRSIEEEEPLADYMTTNSLSAFKKHLYKFTMKPYKKQ